MLQTAKDSVLFEAVLHLSYAKLENAFKWFGFTQIISTECVFKFKNDMHEIIVLVHVEHIVILSPKLSGVKWAKEDLHSLFKCTDLEELKYYLRISFKQM